MTAIIGTLLLTLVISATESCKEHFVPHYVAPTQLKCVPCEQLSESWSWGLKAVWFIIRIITHYEYECCNVDVVKARHLVR